jgi:2-methylcitrate dehydratase PrpD
VDRGWHRTAAFGIFGATAAAGKLLQLNMEQMVNALMPNCTPSSATAPPMR